MASAINAMLERIDREYQVQARFVSDASHELRTPIAVIQGYANMLDRWGKDDPEVRQEAISAIRAEADSMATLVEQLLFLARGDNNTQAVQFKSFDLSAVVDEVYRETELLETGRQVGSAIQPGIQFYGDTGLLKQALRILVDNAVKYTPEGGALFVRLQGKDGIVELSVSDTGQGIAPDDLPKVFQRFFPHRRIPHPSDRRHRSGAVHRPVDRRPARRLDPGDQQTGGGVSIHPGPALGGTGAGGDPSICIIG